jgi:DNA helicase HerA-like ATPase
VSRFPTLKIQEKSVNDIFIGKGTADVYLQARYANRHGMVAGATGTGKSVSLMVLAEGFSRLGVPVFMADVKGDLAGLSQPGAANEKIAARAQKLGLNWAPAANPVVFWDIYGAKGHPVRATISEMGPTLLARLLELNDTQEGVLEVLFKMADDSGLLLLDLKDVRSLLGYAADNVAEISQHYGLVSRQSIAAIQRDLLTLEEAGGDRFFGEPALELADFMRQDMSGRGLINLLAADQLILKPKLYSTFLLWMLSELFETLPEVGDLDLPKMVFFFDEAHLLFDDAPPALIQRVEQVVRLIRSKGVGIYFCSQNPDDAPEVVLGQLSNRIQHALRAYTPRDQKAVRAAAETFPPNPQVDVVAAITQLGVGEALVSTLQEGGVPLPVEQVLVAPPASRIGAITDEERQLMRSRSPIGGKYDTAIDRESAYEKISARVTAQQEAAPQLQTTSRRHSSPQSQPPLQSSATTGGLGDVMQDILLGTGRRQGLIEVMSKSAVRSVGNQIGRQVIRGLLGGLMRR